ncbi:SAM-dependent methyltransferase [Paenibacillus mucilaginosus 3016]|uniref:SAM-dependent methyltransferase n=2 Tax=Paenibacillus mucilaginosus TaxID=61624 RepID=H6NI90_9BACL|nr:class I SAM-dependent methyltransferase [Paenibacillus mucilaginosus]AFC31493.1 SAM-dependent methyltransferase [Paenibacillus mucilaginosus 3016]AFH63834.1 SAM-dependent methyltransferase [Paenibacillus mucilaginosus K02]WFA20037.1 class I SAM-dependent methyltransferase [Paenibacillus mucilaginosus]
MEQIAASNREGWSKHAYRAWVRGKGSPQAMARELQADPWRKLAPLRSVLGDPGGCRVANLLGSNGKAAVSLSLLGADVTVVDLSPDNARYALELAEAAGVRIRYVVADVMNLPEGEAPRDCDLVIMELGILHWFADLKRFFQVAAAMLKPGGRLIVRDFHPVHRQLLRWKDGGMTADGDYFDESLRAGAVPYAVFLTEAERAEVPEVYTRGWTMGDIVTAAAEVGLIIRSLKEEKGPAQRWVFPAEAPAGIEERVPGIYTLAADRPGLSILSGKGGVVQ